MLPKRAYTEIDQRARFDIIRYAQCWEDPAVNRIALSIIPQDHVVSIASGGDNTFALLLDNPQSVVGLDISPVQIALCELKKVAIKKMQYPDFAAFVGITPFAGRWECYRALRSSLSPSVRAYFDHHAEIIKTGLVHGGKFETYLKWFRTCILKFTQSSKTIERLLSCRSIEEQKEIYYTFWNNRRWRWLAKVFLSKAAMGRFGRDPAFFKYAKIDSVAQAILNRIEHGLTDLPVRDNYYLHYCLTGNYPDPGCRPPYLLEKNYSKIKANLTKLSFTTDSVEGWLALQPEKTVSKINFSNIFEYMSEHSMADVFDALVKYCRRDLIVAYRSLVVPRNCPRSHQANFLNDTALGKRLHYMDRSFFYGSYVVLKRKRSERAPNHAHDYPTCAD